MSLQRYSEVFIYVKGKVLTEHSSVTIARKSNSQQVNTVFKGYSGESPGSEHLEINIENMVPSADFELDPGQFIQDLEVVDLQFYCAGKALTTQGFFIEDSLAHAVDSASKLSFTIRALYRQWE